MNRRALIATLTLAQVILPAAVALAVEGGNRPLSMGGAFISVADDVHAASWNPAGLAWQKSNEFTITGVVNNREDYISGDFISDDYLAYAHPLNNYWFRKNNIDGTLGVYLHTLTYESGGTETQMIQPGISYGFKLSEDMGLGLGLNYFSFDAQVPGASSTDAALGFNLGYLWYLNKTFTLGLVWENINEPSYSLFNMDLRLTRVMRAGITCYPAPDTLFSLEIYDLTGNTKDHGGDYSQDLRLGMEHYLTDKLSLRLGGHHLNSEVDSSKFYSMGFGWQNAYFVGTIPFNYYLDYALVYWPEALGSMQDLTHQLGITVRF